MDKRDKSKGCATGVAEPIIMLPWIDLYCGGKERLAKDNRKQDKKPKRRKK